AKPRALSVKFRLKPPIVKHTEGHTEMAILKFEGQLAEIPNGERILPFAEDLGMPFGCTDGLCGTCRCTVVSGAKNLPPRNDKEEDMDLDDGERLACQLVILQGEVELSVD